MKNKIILIFSLFFLYSCQAKLEEVFSRYAGGTTTNPTYNSIGTGRTGHAESVEVIYDKSKISFETLVDVFFGSHDPTTLNRQGPDIGSQYRSIAFYKNEEEKEIINRKIDSLTNKNIFKKSIKTKTKVLFMS